MKVKIVVVLLSFIFVLGAFAHGAERCEICGMVISETERHIIHLKDGTRSAVCSFACASTLIEKIGDANVMKVEAGDFLTGRLIDAQKAYYVEGSKMKGHMGSICLPFVDETIAKRFVEKKGGRVTSFSNCLETQRKKNMDSKRHGHMGD